MELYLNFQRGGGSLEKKKTSVGEAWKFSGATQCKYMNMYISSKK